MRKQKEKVRKQPHSPLQKKKRIKCLGISLPKEGKDLYIENYNKDLYIENTDERNQR